MNEQDRNAIAARVAKDIPPGAYVNLGVGMPTLVANYLNPDDEVILHSENGVLGRWQAAKPGQEDWEMINAAKEPIVLTSPGAAFFHQSDSFGMMRGGHLDICVLGAFQVSAQGDLANWHTGKAGAIPAVGGAMDLACGARQIFVTMEHCDREGRSKILPRCSYPLTGLRCVRRIYTELATIDITPKGLMVTYLAPHITEQQLRELSEVNLNFSALR